MPFIFLNGSDLKFLQSTDDYGGISLLELGGVGLDCSAFIDSFQSGLLNKITLVVHGFLY